MSAKGSKKKSPRLTGDQRRVRTQQVIFIVISILIILAMMLSFAIYL